MIFTTFVSLIAFRLKILIYLWIKIRLSHSSRLKSRLLKFNYPSYISAPATHSFSARSNSSTNKNCRTSNTHSTSITFTRRSREISQRGSHDRTKRDKRANDKRIVTETRHDISASHVAATAEQQGINIARGWLLTLVTRRRNSGRASR